MRTVGDLAYYMQRFFDDVKAAYINTAAPNAPLLLGNEHGGLPDQVVTANTPFVNVQLQPNGCIKLFFSPLWTKHFWLEVSNYGKKVLGLSEDNVIAFRTVGDNIVTGLPALTDGTFNIVAGESAATIEFVSLYPVDRFFEHRVRVELRSDMGFPPTVVWDVDDKESYSHVLATFPITTKTTTGVSCNNAGTTTNEVVYSSEVLAGNIVFRRAEDRVSERYQLLNAQYFHDIRLQVYIVRKIWKEAEETFIFQSEKLEFEPGQSWTAKLRFRST